MHRVNFVKHLLVKLGLNASVWLVNEQLIIEVNRREFHLCRQQLERWFEVSQIENERIILTEKLLGGSDI